MTETTGTRPGEHWPGKEGKTALFRAYPGITAPFVHTYSIVARDSHTGQIGVAVQRSQRRRMRGMQYLSRCNRHDDLKTC